MLWLRSFLSALDASLGSKIIQTLHFLVAVSSTTGTGTGTLLRKQSHVRFAIYLRVSLKPMGCLLLVTYRVGGNYRCTVAPRNTEPCSRTQHTDGYGEQSFVSASGADLVSVGGSSFPFQCLPPVVLIWRYLHAVSCNYSYCWKAQGLKSRPSDDNRSAYGP